MPRTHTYRVQTLLTDEQYDTLMRLANAQHRPLSALVREAVEQTYCIEADRERRRASLGRLLTLDAPVADWPAMEEDIARGHCE